MNNEKALEILNSNYDVLEGSMLYCLHEECVFDKAAFWEIYDAIIILAGREFEKSQEHDITMKICICYNRILKEIISHFDNNDAVVLDGFPNNYYDYIDRLDAAIEAFFTGRFADESVFCLQRDDN